MLRTSLLLVVLLLSAGSATAFDLGNRAPAKPLIGGVAPAADPGVLRQGGDTVLDAILIEVPGYAGAGTTVGYGDDYDEACPYTGSTAPDVVYTFEATADLELDIDLQGSTYDTKLYVYDENLEVVACNDDFYADYVSKIEGLSVNAGTTYFVIVDGYGAEAGDYMIAFEEVVPCEVDCPTGYPYCPTHHENEPPLVDGYVDAHNGGCNSPDQGNPFQDLSAISSPCIFFCGSSGWYLDGDGEPMRDTDWFVLDIGDYGDTQIEIEVEQPTYLFELAPLDCGSVAVVQDVLVPPCTRMDLQLTGDPYSDRWIWVGPSTFSSPDGGTGEYSYYLSILRGSVATEQRSFSSVKALFH